MSDPTTAAAGGYRRNASVTSQLEALLFSSTDDRQAALHVREQSPGLVVNYRAWEESLQQSIESDRAYMQEHGAGPAGETPGENDDPGEPLAWEASEITWHIQEVMDSLGGQFAPASTHLQNARVLTEAAANGPGEPDLRERIARALIQHDGNWHDAYLSVRPDTDLDVMNSAMHGVEAHRRSELLAYAAATGVDIDPETAALSTRTGASLDQREQAARDQAATLRIQPPQAPARATETGPLSDPRVRAQLDRLLHSTEPERRAALRVREPAHVEASANAQSAPQVASDLDELLDFMGGRYASPATHLELAELYSRPFALGTVADPSPRQLAAVALHGRAGDWHAAFLNAYPDADPAIVTNAVRDFEIDRRNALLTHAERSGVHLNAQTGALDVPDHIQLASRDLAPLVERAARESGRTDAHVYPSGASDTGVLLAVGTTTAPAAPPASAVEGASAAAPALALEGVRLLAATRPTRVVAITANTAAITDRPRTAHPTRDTGLGR